RDARVLDPDLAEAVAPDPADVGPGRSAGAVVVDDRVADQHVAAATEPHQVHACRGALVVRDERVADGERGPGRDAARAEPAGRVAADGRVHDRQRGTDLAADAGPVARARVVAHGRVVEDGRPAPGVV